MSIFHDEVEIEDFDYDEELETFFYPCPCGDLFRITRDELEDGEEVARCPSCSLIIRVVYDEADFESGSESESDDDTAGVQPAEQRKAGLPANARPAEAEVKEQGRGAGADAARAGDGDGGDESATKTAAAAPPATSGSDSDSDGDGVPLSTVVIDGVEVAAGADDLAAAFAFDDDSGDEVAEVTMAGPAVEMVDAIAVGAAGAVDIAPDAAGVGGAGDGPGARSTDHGAPAVATAAPAMGDAAPVRLDGLAAEAIRGGEAKAATEGEAGLGIGTINAVRKEGVGAAAAAGFNVIPRGIPEGLNPTLTDVGLPAGMDAFVIDGVLTSSECRMLIERAEHANLTFWDTTRPDDAIRKDYRNADTVEVPSLELATALWSRMEHLIPCSEIRIDEGCGQRDQPDLRGEWHGENTNEKVLFARYQQGGHFSPHTDGYQVVDFNYRSMHTVLIYLNTCEGGGGTRFYTDNQVTTLRPDESGRLTGQPENVITTVQAVQGRALCFFHNIVHEGVAVAPGTTKYIIRSDLMYRRTPAVCDSPRDREAFALYQEADELSAQGKVDESMQMYRKCVKMSPALAAIYGL